MSYAGPERTFEICLDDETCEVVYEYEVNPVGRIVSPGKFEGERRYVPYFWGQVLEGWATDLPDGGVKLRVDPEEKILFPELKDRKRVRMVEREDGFVCEY